MPRYGKFVQGEIKKKGERHPSILTKFWFSRPAKAQLGKPVRRPVHDDYLFGAALIAHLDRAYLEGHVILGAAESVVLPGRAGTEGLEQW